MVGLTGIHVPIGGIACESCHSPTSTSTGAFGIAWTMGSKGHALVSGTTCATCHADGTPYTGVTKQNSIIAHLVTAAACDTCHTASNTSGFLNFLGAVGGHTAPSAPGQCLNSGCHVSGGAGKLYVSGTHIPATGIQCDVCHTTSYASLSFLTATMSHTAVTGTRCDACHNGSYTSQGNIAGAQSKLSITNHIPTTITGSLDCNTCHASSPTVSATGFNTGERMNHNGAQGGGTTPAGVYCVNCHLSGVTYMGTMQKKSHNGASTAKDCSRSSCHKPLGTIGSTYSNWN